MRTITSRTMVACLALLALTAGAAAQSRSTQSNISSREAGPDISLVQPSARIEAAAGQRGEVRVPQTAKDHFELAALYERFENQQRAEATSLRTSLETELRRLAVPPNKTGSEFPWVTKVKRQMEPKIGAAEQTAKDAQRAADYHRFRAKEVEGLEFAKLAGDLRADPR